MKRIMYLAVRVWQAPRVIIGDWQAKRLESCSKKSLIKFNSVQIQNLVGMGTSMNGVTTYGRRAYI